MDTGAEYLFRPEEAKKSRGGSPRGKKRRGFFASADMVFIDGMPVVEYVRNYSPGNAKGKVPLAGLARRARVAVRQLLYGSRSVSSANCRSVSASPRIVSESPISRKASVTLSRVMPASPA